MAKKKKKSSATAEAARKAGANMPSDFREAEATGDGTVSVTVQGLEIEVDRNAIAGDFEVIEALSALNDGSGGPSELLLVMRAVLGQSMPTVKDHLRDENGRVSMEVMSTFMSEVFEALNPGN